MNIIIVGEGEIGESKVYRTWVPFINPSLNYVDHVSKIVENNFCITIGGGYPNYFDVIDNAIADVNSFGNIDRLVIAIDSEDFTYEERYEEIKQHIYGKHCSAEIHIIVQHFCLETWALANQTIIRPTPQCEKLREYMRVYNVRQNDPALLPALPSSNLNRAKFAEKYLRRALQDKHRNLTYSKSNPEALLHINYFNRVKQRFEGMNHIQSFEHFLSAFKNP
ncbi:hypothetical protein HXX01_05655 [Candidatus Nomurabacteria bacterium]|nr:hypothetical protein [Candidatus Nomurabacteria bacterium]